MLTTRGRRNDLSFFEDENDSWAPPLVRRLYEDSSVSDLTLAGDFYILRVFIRRSIVPQNRVYSALFQFLASHPWSDHMDFLESLPLPDVAFPRAYFPGEVGPGKVALAAIREFELEVRKPAQALVAGLTGEEAVFQHCLCRGEVRIGILRRPGGNHWHCYGAPYRELRLLAEQPHIAHDASLVVNRQFLEVLDKAQGYVHLKVEDREDPEGGMDAHCFGAAPLSAILGVDVGY